MKRLIIIIAILLSLLYLPTMSTYAQTQVQCGDIIEAEFANDRESHEYSLSLAAGDKFEVSVKPLGDTLQTVLALWGPSRILVGVNDNNNSYYAGVEPLPTATTQILSASGEYIVQVANAELIISNQNKDVGKFAPSGQLGGVGVYTLYIGCTKRDGAVINPGDAAQPSANDGSDDNGKGSSVSNPPFSGEGFPGLAPVDFSQATKLKLPRSGEVEGEISPDDSDVLGFTFDATEAQQFDLSFARVSGNLNLGLVILSSDNKVYFQTSLVASSELTTKLTLPAGRYTLGIFKIDLVAPPTAEATEFAITLK